MATNPVTQAIDQATEAIDRTSLQANGLLLALLQLVNTRLTDDFRIDALLPDSYRYPEPPQVAFPIFSARRPTIFAGASPPPEAPPATAFSPVAPVTMPELTAAAPTLDLPTLPSATLPSGPGGAPEFVQPDIPSAPVVVLPAVPTFVSLALPEPPSVNLPSLAASIPIDELVVPSDTFSFAEAPYTATLLDPLRATLLHDLENGGYGLDPADESAMFQKARDEEAKVMRVKEDEILKSYARRGFPLPPGGMAVDIDREYRASQIRLSNTSRDIMRERASLYVKGRQFTIEQVKGVEKICLDFHSAVQERALNVAKTTLEATLSVYAALLQRYRLRWEAFGAEATAFAERLRGELAKVALFKSQAEAAGLTVETQRNLVELYKAQLAGVQATVSIHKIQMDGASTRATIERQKIEAYRARVELYAVEVQAKAAEFEMHRAAIQGQQARISIYQSQVDAYGGQIAAAKTRSDVQLGRLAAETEIARSKNVGYAAQVEAYRAQVQRAIEGNRLEIELYKADIDNARAANDGRHANAALEQKGIEAVGQQRVDIARISVENAVAKLKAILEQFRFRLEGQKYATDQYFGRLQSLTSAVQTLSVQTSEV